MGPIWGRQDPGGPHVGPMNFGIWVSMNFLFNTLRPRQIGHHFADDTFKRIFLYENVWISIEIPLKFVPNAPINNILALVKIMAWRRPGDKPLSETMMVRLLTHICVTRPQWVKSHISRNIILPSSFLLDQLAIQAIISVPMYIDSMGECKKDVTPLLTHLIYVFLALTHRIWVLNVYLLGLHSRSLCRHCWWNRKVSFSRAEVGSEWTGILWPWQRRQPDHDLVL